jgi:hypothetical protein
MLDLPLSTLILHERLRLVLVVHTSEQLLEVEKVLCTMTCPKIGTWHGIINQDFSPKPRPGLLGGLALPPEPSSLIERSYEPSIIQPEKRIWNSTVNHLISEKENRIHFGASLGHRSPVFQLPKVLLAGMNIAASPQLAAAVTNAGGLGVWGGVFYTPKMFRAKLKDGGLGCGDGHSGDRKWWMASSCGMTSMGNILWEE